MIAEMGTPSGLSTSGARAGLLRIGAVKRLLGCAHFSLETGVHLSPRQSRHSLGGSPSLPSHHTSPSAVSPTLVKRVSFSINFIALGFDRRFVPGTTPK